MNAMREMYDKLIEKLFCVLYNERGQGLVEYGLLIVLIALIVIIMLRGTGQQVNTTYSKINSTLGGI